MVRGPHLAIKSFKKYQKVDKIVKKQYLKRDLLTIFHNLKDMGKQRKEWWSLEAVPKWEKRAFDQRV